MNCNNVYLSVIVPAYNEEAVIKNTLKKILNFLANQDYNFEIIVVDDGSPDNTAKIVNEISNQFSSVKLISNEKCSGKGSAVKKGVINSSGKYILIADADYTYPIEQINYFLSELEKGNFIAAIGNRRDSRTIYRLSPQAINYVHSRHVISCIFNMIVNIFLIRDVSDTQCGFKCYSSDFIKEIIQKIKISNFAYDVEVLFLIKKFGGRFCQLPVHYNYIDEPSSVHLLRDSIRMLMSLVSIKIRDRRNLYECAEEKDSIRKKCNVYFRDQKQIIVNADDFGLTKGINEGIIKSIKDGIVTSVSIMSNVHAFKDAVQKIADYPDVSIGVHLNLLRGKSVLPPAEAATLVDNGGMFYPLFIFARRLFLGKINLNELEMEMSAQIEKVLQERLQITHLDSHCHVHLLPVILKALIKVAKKYDIHRVRCSLNKLEFPINFKNSLLYNFAKSAFLKLRTEGFLTPDGYYDLIRIENHNDNERLSRIFQKVPIGVTELCCHPGFVTDELDPAENKVYNREKHVKILKDQNILRLMKEAGIQLVSYSAL